MDCQYKDIFGQPGTGAHTHVFGIAVVDLGLTIGGALVISKLTGKSAWFILFILLIMGIFLHWVFCVETTFAKLLRLA
jgi:hypothetical protein